MRIYIINIFIISMSTKTQARIGRPPKHLQQQQQQQQVSKKRTRGAPRCVILLSFFYSFLIRTFSPPSIQDEENSPTSTGSVTSTATASNNNAGGKRNKHKNGSSSSSSSNGGGSSNNRKDQPGRWNEEEHMLFLKGLEIYGKSWKKISQIVKTRTVVQIRTHAQKYLIKSEKAKRLGLQGQVMMDGKAVTSRVSSPCMWMDGWMACACY